MGQTWLRAKRCRSVRPSVLLPHSPSAVSYTHLDVYKRQAPYRKIDKENPENPIVTEEVVYMTADEEDNYLSLIHI